MSSGPVTSSSWHRVSALRPRLRTQARLYRHRYRGEVWYLLQDPATGRVHRFTPAARLLIAAMNGERTVDELWTIANRHLGDDAPTQDEVIQLLGQLHGTDLLQTDVTPDTAELFERGEREVNTKRRRSWTNPMALRLPLWDPETFLNRTQWLARPLWSRWGALLWLVVVLPALLMVPAQWGELTENLSDRVLAVDNLLLLWLVFPALKALHELGHAYATKAGGGEVHDMGLMFLVLMPVPYVEASAATVFRSKTQRAVVGAAGMLVEMFVAALAFYLWLMAEPGLVRAVLFNVMLVAGMSTVIFNGNPLLRYDAYYILVDLIEMPNLAQRSLKYWSHLFERYLLGVRDGEDVAHTTGERLWFLFYGFASTLYRIFVTVAIALFVATQFFFIGVLLALWAVATMALVPVFKGLRHLFTSGRLARHRTRSMAVVGGALATLLVLVLVVPMPFRTQAEGVVWLPDESLVRAGRNGFVTAVLAVPGSSVRPGDALVRLEDPALQAELQRLQARVDELGIELASRMFSQPAEAEIVRQKLQAEQTGLRLAREHADRLVAVAGAAGVFQLPQGGDLLGRYLRQGEVLGYVIDPARVQQTTLARVVITQAEIDVVRLTTDRVQVRLSDQLAQVIEGRVVREVPAGESLLPSRALATSGGGRIATDPQDPHGTKTLERLFQFDVEIPSGPAAELFGQRVHVRFDHQREPLGRQWYRGIRRVFLTQFQV
ncbi:peptidase M50 [Hydrogenophaga sp. PBL-H3]|uniref:peptidase M50 n=1 Tax=Hydrogenophaga sp. PBL-H3 TaxID=434010 RepID=UPI0013584D4B|nr:peptidase M50 [Hydrogenophaga sp. PBL-H3]